MLSTIRRHLSTAAGAVVLLAALSACSSPEAPAALDQTPVAAQGDEIATLETEAPAPSATTDPLFVEYGEPVRLRLDMSDEEETAAWQPRERCLADRSPEPGNPAGGTDGGGSSTSAVAGAPASAEAEALCTRLSPLPPWELDAQNPDALAFAQGVVDCLRGHGVTEVEITPADEFGRIAFALGGESNDSASISLGMQFTDSCMAETPEGRGE